MKARSYFLRTMATLFAAMSLLFIYIGNTTDSPESWKPALCCLTFSGFFFFIERIVASTPETEHIEDK